jgi:hypothetical protein
MMVLLFRDLFNRDGLRTIPYIQNSRRSLNIKRRFHQNASIADEKKKAIKATKW